MGITYDTYDGYSKELWMNGLKDSEEYNIRHLLMTFARLGRPKSMLDIGCGTGTMVRTSRMLGVDAYGVDQLIEPGKEPFLFHHNLVNYFYAPIQVELVFCIEIAEHLHESAHATLCDTIVNNLAPGGHLIFSAARPGQGGTGHISCRPAEYWGNELTLRKMTQDLFLTMNLAHLYSCMNSPLNYWWDNLMVWVK